MTNYLVEITVVGYRNKHIMEIVGVEAETSAAALVKLRGTVKNLLRIEHVYLDDGDMTEVCHIEGKPLPCEDCAKLTRGEFPSSWIQLYG